MPHGMQHMHHAADCAAAVALGLCHLHTLPLLMLMHFCTCAAAGKVMVLEALLKGIKASEPTDKVVLVSNYTGVAMKYGPGRKPPHTSAYFCLAAEYEAQEAHAQCIYMPPFNRQSDW